MIRISHRRERSQKDRIPRHEVQKPRRASQDFPRHQRPSTQYTTEHLSASNVDVSGKQDGHVVRGAQAVGGDVCADRADCEGEGGEKGEGAVVPLVDAIQVQVGFPLGSGVGGDGG